MDGDEFIDKLIECRLGVKEKTIFEVERSFFKRYELYTSLYSVMLCRLLYNMYGILPE